MFDFFGITSYIGKPLSRTSTARWTEPERPLRGCALVSDRCSDTHVALGRAACSRTSYVTITPGDPLAPDLEPGSWALCYGRLDGLAELRAELGRHAGSAGASLAQLVLAAYVRWGIDCPRCLLGDYAFLLWDAGDRRLLAGRDPAQAVPLYYSIDGEAFRWASCPDPLAEAAAPTRRWDLDYLTTYTVLGNLNWERTPYADVYQVAGGTTVEIHQGKRTVRRWWNLPAAGSLRYRHARDYEAHFRSLLREAVRDRLVTKGVASVTLSRGIDSSAIAATARELEREGSLSCAGLQAITGSEPDYPEGDESRDAAAIARHLGLAQQIVPTQPYPGDMRIALARSPEPCGVVNNWNFWASMQDVCRDTGSRVLLTGTGGELLSCNPYYLANMLRERRYLQLPGELRQWLGAGLPLRVPLQLAMAGLRGDRISPWEPRQKLPHYPWLRHPELCHVDLESLALPHPLARKLYNWIVEQGHVTAFLPPLFDRGGVELRHPLMDRRLLEFCYALPVSQKLPMRDARGDYHAKAMVRRAFANVLPPGMTKPNAASRVMSGRDLYRDWLTLRKILDRPPDGLEEVVDIPVLRKHAEAYRVDRGGKRWASLTSVLACWLASREQARSAGLLCEPGVAHPLMERR